MPYRTSFILFLRDDGNAFTLAVLAAQNGLFIGHMLPSRPVLLVGGLY